MPSIRARNHRMARTKVALAPTTTATTSKGAGSAGGIPSRRSAARRSVRSGRRSGTTAREADSGTHGGGAGLVLKKIQA